MMTLYAISLAIQEMGGAIWSINVLDFGIVLRAEIGKTQIRVVKMKRDCCESKIPVETNSLLHVVQDLDRLRLWLREATGKQSA